MSLIGILATISEMISYEDGAYSNVFHKYVSIIRKTGLAFAYTSLMIFITVDRLLEIFLNIKYPLYCTAAREKWMLVAMWLTALFILVTVIVLSLMNDYNFQYEIPVMLYLIFPLSISFNILAIVAYVLIFRKYKRSRITQPARVSSRAELTESAWSVFRNSNFFVSVLLITTYIVFVQIPGGVWFVISFLKKDRSDLLVAVRAISYDVSNIFDVYIYVFYDAAVRQYFSSKLRRWKILRKSNKKTRVESNTTSAPTEIGETRV